MPQKPTQVVGKRVAAFIIDGIINFLISAAAWFALTTSVPFKCPAGGGGITIGDNCRGFVVGESGKQTTWYLISLIAGLLIFVVLPGLKGWTPGKAMMGIKLVNAEGRPPGVLRALLRYILWIVDAFPYLIPYLTGFIVALNSERNQRVGDMAAGTFVVDKNAAGGPSAGPGGAIGGGGQQYGGPPPTGAPVSSAAPPQAGGGQKADWYPDPHGQARLRYWDGERWTEHTSA
jgi:uncharacterized RDD family membrane protein YckC